MSSLLHVEIILGVTADGLVKVDFANQPVDHVLLDPAQARELAEGIIEAVKMVERGTPGVLRR